MSFKHLILFIFIFLASLILSFKKVESENFPKVLINEVMPNPVGSDTTYEWIELFNSSEDDIDLSKWKIDGSEIGKGIIKAQGYLVLVRNLTAYPNLQNQSLAQFSLLNTSDTVILENSKDETIDRFEYLNPIEGKSFERRGNICTGYDSSIGTIGILNINFKSTCTFIYPKTPISYPSISLNEIGSSKDFDFLEIKVEKEVDFPLSLIQMKINEKDFDLGNYERKELNFECGDNLSLGLCVLFFEKDFFGKEKLSISFSSKEKKYFENFNIIFLNDRSYGLFSNRYFENLIISIGKENLYAYFRISEINPSIDEWIEIENQSELTTNLNNFFFGEENCTVINTNLTGILESKKLLKIQSKSLNDTGDTIELCGPNKEILDSFTYPEAVKGLSFSRINDKVELSVQTPENSNQKYIKVINNISIADIYNLKNGTEVKIQGIVSSPFSEIFDDSFYLQDNSGGIKIYYKNLESEIKFGDKLVIVGKISESQGEKKLNADFFEKVGVSFFEIGDGIEKIGMRIKARGEVIANYGFSFRIKFKEINIKVSVPRSVEVIRKKGDFIEIDGIYTKDSEGIVLRTDSISKYKINELDNEVSAPSVLSESKKKVNIESGVDNNLLFIDESKLIPIIFLSLIFIIFLLISFLKTKYYNRVVKYLDDKFKRKW